MDNSANNNQDGLPPQVAQPVTPETSVQSLGTVPPAAPQPVASPPSQQPVVPPVTQAIPVSQPEPNPSPDVQQTPVPSSQSLPPSFPPIATQPQHVAMPPLPKSRKKIMLSIVIVLFLLIFLSSSFIVLTAYGKLKIGSPKFRAGVTNFVLSLPFMPKTPDFVLQKSILAGADIQKFTLGLSIAVEDKQFTEMLGFGSFDVDISGPVDASDPERPAMGLRIKVTKEFDLDTKLKNEVLYFKLNKLPPSLGMMLSMFGLDSSIQQAFMNKWFYYDTASLETAARKDLDEKQKEKDDLVSKQITERLTNVMLDEKTQPKLTMNDETVDGFSSFKVQTTLSKQTIDAVEESLYQQSDSDYKKFTPTMSKYLKDVQLTWWVDKKNYYVRKLSASFKVKSEAGDFRLTAAKNSLTQSPGVFPEVPQLNQEIPVSFVIKFSKINEDVSISVPSDAVRFETFMQELFESPQYGYSSPILDPTTQLAQARNTQRRSDVNAVLNAISQYKIDKAGKVPSGIGSVPQTISKVGADVCSALVPTYIAALPTDPTVGGSSGPVTNCATNYYTGYTVVMSQSGVITVNAPYSEAGEYISVSR